METSARGVKVGGAGEQGPDHPWKPCKGSLVKTGWEAVSQARDDGGLAWRNEGGARWTDVRGQEVDSTSPGVGREQGG